MAPPRYRAYLDLDAPADATAFFGLMSFHGAGLCHEESDKAWTAWRNAEDAARVTGGDAYESMLGMMTRTVASQMKIGIASFMLRQDEAVSIEADQRGFTLFRGRIPGLKQMVDEGQLLCGPRDSFLKILTDGGFSMAGAGSYLDRLAQTDSAFATTVQAGCSWRVQLDPETLLSFDREDDCTATGCTSSDEAMPILAVGDFPMPEMTTHRAR